MCFGVPGPPLALSNVKFEARQPAFRWVVSTDTVPVTEPSFTLEEFELSAVRLTLLLSPGLSEPVMLPCRVRAVVGSPTPALPEPEPVDEKNANAMPASASAQVVVRTSTHFFVNFWNISEEP